MAEFPNLGEHCSFSTCKQIDFLPLECTWCHKTFCKDHKEVLDHNCKEVPDSLNYPVYDGPKSVPCTFTDCDQRELTPVVCQFCNENFCLLHRHQVDHNCRMLQAETINKTKSDAFAQFKGQGQKAPNKPTGRKSEATSAKVALMKMKQKAIGDHSIPEVEKLYFNVGLPEGRSLQSLPLFFSKQWTVGRAIDEATNHASIKNENNIESAKKLRFFTGKLDEPLPLDITLCHALEEYDIFNGGNLFLKYIDCV